MGEWARGYEPALLGLSTDEVATLNDDRVGRTLTRLFDADRANLVTGVVLDMVRHFSIDCSQLHNDSTTVSFHGLDYPGGGGTRANRSVAEPAHGHNKDHRADLLQLLWILTVSADGAVPIAYRVASCQHVGRRDPRAHLGGAAPTSRPRGLPLRRGLQAGERSGPELHRRRRALRHDPAPEPQGGVVVHRVSEDPRSELGAG
jgi:hypothetical protein